MLKKFPDVFKSYPDIDEVLIYGSRAKGNYRPGSNIDIIVKGTYVNDEVRIRVWLELDALNTPYFIDLSTYGTINSKSLKEHIDQVWKSFFKRDA